MTKTGGASASRSGNRGRHHSHDAARRSGAAVVDPHLGAAAPDAYSLLENERARIAAHEAGHAAAVRLVGWRNGVCSIEQTKRWSGVNYREPRRVSERDQQQMFGIYPLLPAGVRARLERGALVALAGPVAESLYFDRYLPLATLPTPTPPLPAVAMVTPPTRAERRLVALGNDETQPPDLSDEEQALRALRALSRRNVDRLYEVFHELTIELVEQVEFRRYVDALAPLLLEHTTLGGNAVREILNEVKEAPSWKTSTPNGASPSSTLATPASSA